MRPRPRYNGAAPGIIRETILREGGRSNMKNFGAHVATVLVTLLLALAILNFWSAGRRPEPVVRGQGPQEVATSRRALPRGEPYTLPAIAPPTLADRSIKIKVS